MLYYNHNDLIVSKTGKFYRIIAADPARSTRQRTFYRVRRLSDGREMQKAYQPFLDFWQAPQAAEAALDAGDLEGATRAALAHDYPVDGTAAAAEGADEVQVEVIGVEVEGEDEAEDAAEDVAEDAAEAAAEAEAQAAAEAEAQAMRLVGRKSTQKRVKRAAVAAAATDCDCAREEDAPPPTQGKKTRQQNKKRSKKQPKRSMSETIVPGTPPSSSSGPRTCSAPGAPTRPTTATTSSAVGLSKGQRRRLAKRERNRQRGLPAWMRECPEGCVWEGVVGHAPSKETEPGPWPADSQGDSRPLGEFFH